MDSLFVPEEDGDYNDNENQIHDTNDESHNSSNQIHNSSNQISNQRSLDKLINDEDEFAGDNVPEISTEATRALYARTAENESAIPVVVRDKEETTAIYLSAEICCTLPLGFYQEIVETILSKDGLLVMGRGLGYEMISANVLYALGSPSVSLERGNTTTEKRSLVIVLNAREEELVRLDDLVTELRWVNSADSEVPEAPGIRVVGGSDLTNTQKRRDMYAKGGILSITSRILIVDLLSGVIHPNDITGFLVLHAEKVRETSNESFIVNIYRDANDWGFVKALSDEAEAFTGFTPLASKLKILRLSNVFLWPRFHVEVSSLLMSPKRRTTVTEINVRLSGKMAKIQSAILSCLTACLKELKRHNPSLDTDYWDIENIHDADFVPRVRMSLESQWHRILWTSKQLVHDLATLKELMASLLADDSLTFYQRVQGIVDTNLRTSGAGTMNITSMSPWLMMDEATSIMSYAKERALGKATVQEDHQEDSSLEVYVLEELPKWEQLAMLVDDIMHERSLDATRADGPVLIMCSSGRTAHQLSQVLARARKLSHEATGRSAFSLREYMVSKLREYLHWKELVSLTKRLTVELDSEQREENDDGQDEKSLNTSKAFTRGSNAPRLKRRRTRGAAAVANVARLYSGSDFERTAGAVELDQEIVDRVEQQVKQGLPELPELPELVQSEREQELEDAQEEGGLFVAEEFVPKARIKMEHMEKFNQVIVEPYNERTDELLLQELCPLYIIMYEPDLSFIRRVEVFQAMNPALQAKTYFMYYGTSVEEQTHLMRIRKEKQAFTRLIREKASLGKRFATEQDNWKFHLLKPQAVNTRIAGGAQFRTETDEMRVIVDTREFRSSLPNLLYRVGIQVVPCMLTVGDYVVSPKICVERKAIPDLIGSFKSGRLYQQCEQMFRHYELAVLLIEFEELKSFSFEPFAELRPPGSKATNPLSSRILKQEIQLKITELLVSFPKLKVIWSASPYETAQIFLELKGNQHEPDVEEALAKGVNPTIATSEGPPMFNDDAIDLLQSIPGINNVNYTTVVQKVRDFTELCGLSREEFHVMLGLENGNKAYNFINHEVR